MTSIAVGPNITADKTKTSGGREEKPDLRFQRYRSRKVDYAVSTRVRVISVLVATQKQRSVALESWIT